MPPSGNSNDNNPALELPSYEQIAADGTVTVTGASYTDSFARGNAGSLYLGISDGSGLLYGFYPSATGGANVAAAGSGTDNLVFVGSYADVQDIINSLTYVAAGTVGSDDIHYDVWNQAGVETTGDVPVTIAAAGTNGSGSDATSETWTGSISSDWNTAANWSGNTVPTSGDIVTIPGGTPNAPALSNATISGETIMLAGATVDLNNVVLNASLSGSGGAVEVGGSLTIGEAGTIDAGQLLLNGTAETIVNQGLMLSPNGTLDLTNSAGTHSAVATLVNDGSIDAKVLDLKSAPQYPNGTPDDVVGGPGWMLPNSGTITIANGGTFDLNGTMAGGTIAFAGTGVLDLEQGMAVTDGAIVSGFGPGDQIVLLDPQAGNDSAQPGFANGALEIRTNGTVVQAIPMAGDLGLGNFELESGNGPSSSGTISFEPSGSTTAMIDAPTAASVAPGGTLTLNDVAIDPAAPSSDYETIAIAAGSGTLFMNGANGSGTDQIVLSNLTGQQADADLASLSYVPAAGATTDTVSITVIPPAPVQFTRSIPISIGAATGALPTSIAASDADPLVLTSNAVFSATAGDHMIFIGGTGDTLTATGGTETVQAFSGHNTITTGAGNDSISFAGSGNDINAGGGANTLADSGNDNTIVMPDAGQGMDNVFGYVLQHGDILDFRSALAATSWDGTQATLGNFLQVANVGNDAVISLSPTSGGGASPIADLRDSGQLTMPGLLAHALV